MPIWGMSSGKCRLDIARNSTWGATKSVIMPDGIKKRNYQSIKEDCKTGGLKINICFASQSYI